MPRPSGRGKFTSSLRPATVDLPAPDGPVIAMVLGIDFWFVKLLF